MDFGIKDRVALVAAASKGIGFAAARELAKEGARVFLCSRDEKRASEAAQKLHDETGATVAGIGADVTDNESVEQTGSAWHAVSEVGSHRKHHFRFCEATYRWFVIVEYGARWSDRVGQNRFHRSCRG